MIVMGKEVKVTASELLTADKGVRIGKTMSKSDEPTLIPIDEDLSGAKKKTTNKTIGARANASAGKKISVKGPVNKREAERISDAADALVMDDVKPKRTAKSAIKAPVKVATRSTTKKTNAKALVMDGMVRQKGATKTVDARGTWMRKQMAGN